ncbi:MAG TPA: SH3 domain-containing protein [Bacillus bacterium]|nr:SH3 domain-containing protein [Bacillus sp. (in: firmicutes)]
MVKRSPITFGICSFLVLLTFWLLPLKLVSANEIGQVIVEGNLNVRIAPSTQGDIVGKLQNGEEVQIIKRTGEWLEISSKAGNGFVHNSYIQVHTPSDGSDKVNISQTSNATTNAATMIETSPSAASSSSQEISVYVNGELLKLPIAPPIIDGRVLVPFRGIGENLGINVKWLADTKQVEAVDQNKRVVFTINESKVFVNNDILSITPAPIIVKNNTVIPLRFFAESYGANVQWNEKERKVIIEQKSVNSDREEPLSPINKGEVPPRNNVTTTVQAIIEVDGGTTVYKRPSTKSDTLGELAQGDSVKVYDKPRGNDFDTEEWLEIEYNNDSGYIAADSIRPIKETMNGIVTATTLNIRESADVNSPMVGMLTQGQEVIIYEMNGQWALIKHNGIWGYVNTSYVTMKLNNEQPFTALGEPRLDFIDNNHTWLSWSKIGSVTTSHKLLPNGVEISSNAAQVNEWNDSHPAINRIEYNGSTIRLYFNPGYHFVVRHTTSNVRIILLNSGLAGKRIVVDAGHGAHDPGAKGPSGTKEKDVNLAVALKLADLLRYAGAEVILTRSNDTFLELAERVKVAHANDADAFVSVHSDSFKETSSGTTTFYHSGKNPSWQQSKQLSDIAIKKLTSQLGTISRGSNDKSLHVIRETEIPAILVEMAFLSNPKEEALLKSDEFQQKAAQAIYDSFVQFYN